MLHSTVAVPTLGTPTSNTSEVATGDEPESMCIGHALQGTLIRDIKNQLGQLPPPDPEMITQDDGLKPEIEPEEDKRKALAMEYGNMGKKARVCPRGYGPNECMCNITKYPIWGKQGSVCTCSNRGEKLDPRKLSIRFLLLLTGLCTRQGCCSPYCTYKHSHQESPPPMDVARKFLDMAWAGYSGDSVDHNIAMTAAVHFGKEKNGPVCLVCSPERDKVCTVIIYGILVALLENRRNVGADRLPGTLKNALERLQLTGT